MLMPEHILGKISHHFSFHINAVQEAAEADDAHQLKWLEDRHNQFKANVNDLLDMQIDYVSSVHKLSAPTSEAVKLWSVSLSSVSEPAFPDFIGLNPRWAKLVVAGSDDVYTCLYSLEGWEEEHEYIP